MQEIIDELTQFIFSDTLKNYGGALLIIFGILLLFFSRNKRSTTISATNGGVAVGHDNHGNITTNNNQDSPKQRMHFNKILFIVGTGVSVIGSVITIYTFLIP